MKTVLFKGLMVWLMTVLSKYAFAQPQFLDPAFGNGGKVTTAAGDSASMVFELVVQPDGKLVTAARSSFSGISSFTLVRYLSNGALDPGFGVNGIVTTQIYDQSEATSIALQPDGKIVAGGYAYINTPYERDFAVARYNPDGRMDSTFGNNGIALADFDFGSGGITRLLIKPDGKILTAGYVNLITFETTPALAQFLPTGELDTLFGSLGTAQLNVSTFPGKATQVNDMTLTPDGKILAAVNVEPAGGYLQASDFLIIRLLSNGSMDTTFGYGGEVQTDLNNISGDNAYGIAQLPDSSIMVTGYSYKSSVIQAALVKYRPNGALDSTFGSAGKILTSVSSGCTASRIIRTGDGSLLVSGATAFVTFIQQYGIINTVDFMLIKYLPDGALDSAFGNNGAVITDFSGDADESLSPAIQSDGKIVLAGYAYNGISNMALARYKLVAMPLHLVTFTAKLSEQKATVNLRWTSENELNFDRYEVGRSANGRDFSKVESVKAVSSQSSVVSKHYSYDDVLNSPLTTHHSLYYRLKMVDKDGSFTYSKVEQVSLTAHNSQFTISPNPATNTATLKAESIITHVVITDASGKVVYAADAASNNVVLNIASLAKGIYMVKATFANGAESVVKMVKK